MSRPKRDPDKPIEPDEIIDPPMSPMRQVNLRLDRTRKYVREILDMSAEEALKLINEQVQTKLLLMGEEILRQLEILGGSTNYKERIEASAHIQILTNAITQLSKARLDIVKASGAELAALLPKNGEVETPENEIKEVSIDEFMSRYATTAKQLTPGNVPENTPKNA